MSVIFKMLCVTTVFAIMGSFYPFRSMDFFEKSGVRTDKENTVASFMKQEPMIVTAHKLTGSALMWLNPWDYSKPI